MTKTEAIEENQKHLVAIEGGKQDHQRKLSMYKSLFSRKVHREISSSAGELTIITSDEIQKLLISSQLFGKLGDDIEELSNQNILKIKTYTKSEQSLDEIEDIIDENSLSLTATALLVIRSDYLAHESLI